MRHCTTFALLIGFFVSVGLHEGCAGSATEYTPPPTNSDGGTDAAAADLMTPMDLRRTGCNLVPQNGCMPTEKCTTHDAATTLCDPNGIINRGERCMTQDGIDNCFAGNACTNQGNTIGMCRSFCRTDGDCGTRSYCEIPLGTAGIRVCTQPCNALGNTAGCPSGLACYAYFTEHTDCRLPGNKTEAALCARLEDCLPGMACLGPGGAERCRKLCDRTTGAGCSVGQTCYLVTNGDGSNWPTYGFCL